MTIKRTLIDLLRTRRDYLGLVKIQENTGGWAIALVIDGYYGSEGDVVASLESFLEDFDVPAIVEHKRELYSFKPVAQEMLDDSAFVSRFPHHAARLRKLLDPTL